MASNRYFYEVSGFDSKVHFRSFTNLGNIEELFKYPINKQNGSHSKLARKNDELNEINKKNSNRIIIAHLNINLIWNKLEILKELICNKPDLLLISEAKLDDTLLIPSELVYFREIYFTIQAS